jgi:formamidopyrimidine-DNA glycosylase
MPELPEVETVRRGLELLIVGKTIKTIKHDVEKSFPNDSVVVSEFAVDASIFNVKRRAKVLLIELSTDYTLMVHLKMTGQMVFVGKERFGAGHPNESLVGNLPDRSTRVTITFGDDSRLYFNDQRKFGWMKLLPTGLVVEEPFMLKVGPEPLEPEFTDKIFITRVRKRANTSIKAAILDQTILAGIGNIYADESLWGSKINPATLVKNVSDAKLKKLHKEILFVLNLAIEKGGSTDKNYVNAEGGRGSYIDFARVFRRENLPCPRCDEIIVKTRVAGRGTHTCPRCQKA